MISKWYEYRNSAIILRRNGYSIRYIEGKLGIPRSTLSGWFKGVQLTEVQKQKLRRNWLDALVVARKEAVKWHNKQKEDRIVEARRQALSVLSSINLNDKFIQEFALSMLYLGEGAKKGGMSLGNTDPLIVKYYVSSLNYLYKINKNEIKCDLHLRYDQEPSIFIKYWSKELGIPQENFHTVKDKRTSRSKTFPEYKGVCVIRCGNFAIKRRLNFLSREFCGKISNQMDS